MNTGIHTISADDYHRNAFDDRPALSAGVIGCLLNKSPLHAWHAHPKLNPDWEEKHDPKFDLGTVAHQVLLEGQANIVVVEANDWRTKAAKDTRDLANEAGLTAVLAADWVNVLAMAESVREQLDFFGLDPVPFTDGLPEQTVIWEEDGLLCNARPDWLHTDGTVSDLKTTRASANPEAWCKTTLWGINADVQTRWYQRGLAAITGVEPTFRFVVVEVAPPYALSVVELAPAAKVLADAKIESALALWRSCLRDDVWPGYSRRVAFAEPPAWAEAQWLEKELREVAA